MRTLFLLLLIGGFSLLFYQFTSSKHPLDVADEIYSRTDEDARIEGLHYKEWKDGALTWILDAHVAKYFHQAGVAGFEDAAVTFLPKTGDRISLHAKKVLYDVNTRLLTAEGGVSGESEQGFRFFTRALSYKADEKEVSTPDKVTLEKDRLIIEGVGMEGSLKEQRFVLLSSVRALFTPAEPQPSTRDNRTGGDISPGPSEDRG